MKYNEVAYDEGCIIQEPEEEESDYDSEAESISETTGCRIN